MTNDSARDDFDDVPLASSTRHVWKSHHPSQGSKRLSLKTMAVLYDAGCPLSREELVDRLIQRLDAYERSFIEAWHLHQRERHIRNHLEKNSSPRRNSRRTLESSPRLESPLVIDLRRAVRAWVTEVFCVRLQGGTLVQEADGRLRPGPNPPKAQKMDGTLIPYTPETRRLMEQEEHDQGRSHLVRVDVKRTMAPLTEMERAQVLIHLVRRLLIPRGQSPMVNKKTALTLDRLATISDTPMIKRALLTAALDGLLNEEPR